MLRKKINHLLVQKGKREVKSRGDIEMLMRESDVRYSPPSAKKDWLEKRVRIAVEEM